MIGFVEEGDKEKGQHGIEDQQNGNGPHDRVPQLVEVEIRQVPVDLQQLIGQQPQNVRC